MTINHTIQLRFQWAEAANAFAKLIRRDARFTIIDADAPPSGLVVVEARLDNNVADTVHQLATNPEVEEIFVLAKEKDPDLILQTLRAGATEFLPLPIRGQDFTEALNRFADRRHKALAIETAASVAKASAPVQTPQQQEGRIVTVLGGKFGVGTTTIAVNLAVACAEGSAKQDGQISPDTVLVDARRPYGEVPLFLDLDYTYSWAEVTRDVERLDEAFVQSLMVQHSSGLDVLAAPDHEGHTGSAATDGMKGMLQLLKQRYALTVLDSGPYLDELSLAVLEASDTILLVTELSLPCLGGARRLLDSLENINPSLLDSVRLVVNRYCPDGGISVAEAEELLGSRVAWRIEDDHAGVISAVNQGLPLGQAAPRSPVTRAVQQMAASFTNTQPESSSGSLLTRMISGFTRKQKESEQVTSTNFSGLAANALGNAEG